jgi:LysR family nitrogen assimilation transcriptional regulator
MDLKQLRAFVTIAETGNLTRAAELLHLVQPAVSRQLRLLEDDVGAQLFRRERHGMALTDAGRALLAHARRALLELDRGRAELRGTTQEPAGIVTVGLLPSTVGVLGSALVHAVAARHPRIGLRIVVGYAGTLQQWLEGGEIDVAVLYGVEHASRLRAQPLLAEPLWVAGPASAGLRAAQPVPLAQLASRPLVLPNGPQGLRTLLDHACAVAGVGLTAAAETNAMDAQKALVIGGHGWTVLPPIAFAAELGAGLLSGAPLADPRIERTIALALPAHRDGGAHVVRVAALLEDCARRAVAQGGWPEARWVGPDLPPPGPAGTARARSTEEKFLA